MGCLYYKFFFNFILWLEFCFYRIFCGLVFCRVDLGNVVVGNIKECLIKFFIVLFRCFILFLLFEGIY